MGHDTMNLPTYRATVAELRGSIDGSRYYNIDSMYGIVEKFVERIYVPDIQCISRLIVFVFVVVLYRNIGGMVGSLVFAVK